MSNQTTSVETSNQKDVPFLIRCLGNDNFSMPENEFQSYSKRLCSMSIASLQQEPQLLSKAQKQLADQSQEMLFTHYDAIIDSACITKSTDEGIKNIFTHLQDFSSTLPKLSKHIQNFSEEAKNISKRWRETSLMLSKHSQILEFLEIPQLMDSCIRQGAYEDCLNLLDYVRQLNRMHGKQVPLISKIANQAEDFKEVMVQYLIKELYLSEQLNAQIKVVQHLKCLKVFDECELRIKFLIARDSWLQNRIKNIAHENVLENLIALIEMNRSGLFDIVTQYRTIFPINENHFFVSDTNHFLTVDSDSKLDNQIAKDFGHSGILISWLYMKLDRLLAECEQKSISSLSKLADQCDQVPSLLQSLQLMADTMVRVGADIYPQLVQMMQRLVEELFQFRLAQTVQRFEQSLNNYAIPYKTIKSLPYEKELNENENEDGLCPPISLMKFVPLARLLNDLLSTLNDFRTFILVNIVQKLKELLNCSLHTISTIVAKYVRAETSGLHQEEQAVLREFCDQYAFVLVSHIRECFALYLPFDETAQMLGISRLELTKLRKNNEQIALAQLNLDYILEPVQEFIQS